MYNKTLFFRVPWFHSKKKFPQSNKMRAIGRIFGVPLFQEQEWVYLPQQQKQGMSWADEISKPRLYTVINKHSRLWAVDVYSIP